MLCECRLGQRHKHAQVPIWLYFYPRPRPGKLQDQARDMRHGVLKYRKSVRANFGRNTCTSDIFDAAPNRRTNPQTLQPLQPPRLCSADLGIVLHKQHNSNSVISALVAGGGRSIGGMSATRWLLLLRGCGKHATVSIGIGSGELHVGRTGPTWGPSVATREVRRERWRPAKAPAGPADRH
jgi:hypothetical protein